MIRKHQWNIFWLVCAVCFFVLARQVWIMMPVFADTDLRERASTIIQATVAREGWLNSGLTLVSIDDEKAVLLYRSHMRGVDPVQCYELSLDSGSLMPCPGR